MLLVVGAAPSFALAQQPSRTAPPTHRAPIIELVVPADGAPIPADNPVVRLRFVAGDSSDAIDSSSLRMSVDGQDRTRLLQRDDREAWGPLAPDSAMASPTAGSGRPAPEALITPGVHLLHARVCSMRGVCGIFDAAVTVIPVDAATPSAASAPDSSAQHQSPISLIRLLLELVLAIARKLITP